MKALRRLPIHVVILIAALFVLLPFLYGLLGAFKDNAQLSTNPLGLPSPWVPSNFTDVFSAGNFWRQLLNSTYIAIVTTVLLVALSALAAFAFARLSFRGREFYYVLFTIGLMFPFTVAVLPLFVLLRTVGLLDNPLGVILPQVAYGLPITIIILRAFFRAIPREVEEAATIDGCTAYGFFWRVLLPMARPALATVSVLGVVASWNNFLLPLLIFTDPNQMTLPLGVQQFQGLYASDYAKILAYVTCSMVPALLFFTVAERQLISGLTAGATKG